MRGGGIAIVGAGPAGLAAARAYRESGGSAAVTIVGRERDAPYRQRSRAGKLVGVLTSERDGDYERGRELIQRGAGGP